MISQSCTLSCHRKCDPSSHIYPFFQAPEQRTWSMDKYTYQARFTRSWTLISQLCLFLSPEVTAMAETLSDRSSKLEGGWLISFAFTRLSGIARVYYDQYTLCHCQVVRFVNIIFFTKYEDWRGFGDLLLLGQLLQVLFSPSRNSCLFWSFDGMCSEELLIHWC